MEVQINEKTYSIPESWNMLSKEQVLACYTILMTDSQDLFEPQELLPAKRIGLVQYLLKLDLEFLKAWEADCLQAHGEAGQHIFLAELSEIIKAADFLLEEQKENHFQIKLGLTKCPWPKLEHKSKKKGRIKKEAWYAPADGLENLSLYELGYTFTLFEAFLEQQDPALADELIATLYRPSKPATKENKRSAYRGDRRLPLLYHEETIKKRMKRIALLPEPVKQVLLFWFASCRQAIIEAYPSVFTSSSSSEGGGWGDFLLALSGGLSNLEAVGQLGFQDGFGYVRFLESKEKKK